MTEHVHDPPIDAVLDPPLAERFGWPWWIGLALAAIGVLLLLYGLSGPAFTGIGVWGTTIPYVWGFGIASYAWWIGIANGAALLAAILVLIRNSLRTAINRFANGVALAAALCAAIFPVFHLGRPWRAYWMIPYPTAFGLWPQFRSPLTWDFWSILVYMTVIALLWYVGLIPDLATLRDRAKSRRLQLAYGLFALGWRGSARQWALHQRAHRVVALILIPLLFVAQTVVSFETVATLAPAWHETREPLHFIFSGFESGLAMVLLVALVLRTRLGLHRHIDDGDLDLLGTLLAATALALAYVYALGWFLTWLGGGEARDALWVRMAGPYWPLYWAGLLLALLPPQFLWSRRFRMSAAAGMAVSLAVLAGLYCDHLSIIVAGIERGRLMVAPPSYAPTLAEASLLIGTVGLFTLLALLSVRFLPIISLYDTRNDALLAGR